jgi:hypothetical protein
MADKQKAGAFDIRVVIAALIGAYGVVLTILGIIADPAEVAKADGLNINLWGGIGMLVFAALFVLWSRLRPIVVPADTGGGDAPTDPAKAPVE